MLDGPQGGHTRILGAATGRWAGCGSCAAHRGHLQTGLAIRHRVQLPADGLHALRQLTFCERLDVDALSQIVGDDAVEAAPTRGLISALEDHDRVEVRFSHALCGEVVRPRLGLTAARRPRGGFVGAPKSQPLTGPADRSARRS